MKQTLALAVPAAFIICMTYGALNLRADKGDHKMMVCHVTGNGTAHVIDIDKHAWPSHQAHGDSTIDNTTGLRAGDPCVVTSPPPSMPPPPDTPPVVVWK